MSPEEAPMFNVTQPQVRPDDSGCDHSNLDGPSRNIGIYEAFRCPKCGNQITRKLDESGKPTGESFIYQLSSSEETR
jgi:predicted RNA-binding Zn-ribbon protein involved in translation (DUF1610 family)